LPKCSEKGDCMKYEDKTTKEDEENRIIRIDVTAENWEENKLLAKGMGIEIDEPKYVEYVIDLKKEE
jgi:hypothetical protein